ncbi:hypothetical protein EGW08_002221 [Elysia chlorotica]|uniref:Uncharacterized protein n=1 Tax=Elysia chlorotica TaxID=188477 RepID=A0A433U887_ELYCH|nr:hypothetical protein EGW08_002221 [Elysia chlorotica]
MKGVFSFLVGIYFGVVASQRYQVPRTPTPSEAWHEFKSKRRERHRSMCECECDDEIDRDRERSRPHRPMGWSNEQDKVPIEIREAIEKIKAFERRFRKPEYRDLGGGVQYRGTEKTSPTPSPSTFQGEKVESSNSPPE